MPTAITHDPVFTTPVSSTNTAVVRWSGTAGSVLQNSGVLIDGSNNITGIGTIASGAITSSGAIIGTQVDILAAGDLRLQDSTGGQYVALEAAGTTTTHTLTLPATQGSASTVLTNNGSGVLSWAAAGSSGAALTGSTNNTVVTVTGADAMQGEANLTYDGSELKVAGSGAKLVLDQDSGDAYLLELRSTDVTTGLSRGTNVYGQFMKKHATSGMLQIWGFSDSDANQAIGMSLAGISGIAANATKSTAAIGIVEINTGVISSGSIINPAVNGNMVVIRDAASGNSKFIFDEDGDGHADSSWTTYSDSRLKFNQEVIPYGLDTLMQLQPKVYDRDSGYLEDGVPILEGKRNKQIGFIAQEVKALIPEVIKDIDDEATSWYSLDDGKLMAVVVKAVQELNDKVTALGG